MDAGCGHHACKECSTCLVKEMEGVLSHYMDKTGPDVFKARVAKRAMGTLRRLSWPLTCDQDVDNLYTLGALLLLQPVQLCDSRLTYKLMMSSAFWGGAAEAKAWNILAVGGRKNTPPTHHCTPEQCAQEYNSSNRCLSAQTSACWLKPLPQPVGSKPQPFGSNLCLCLSAQTRLPTGSNLCLHMLLPDG